MADEPKSGLYEASDVGGLVYEYGHNGVTPVQPEYVEFTAPQVCCLTVTVDGTLCTKAWAGAGGAHSWWTAAGGRFLRYPLKKGQLLRVFLDKQGAVRIDWYE